MDPTENLPATEASPGKNPIQEDSTTTIQEDNPVSPPYTIGQSALISDDAQSGVVAATRLRPGSSILSVSQPLVTVVDNAHLMETCSGCFMWYPPRSESSAGFGGGEGGATEGSGPRQGELKTCLGCKTVRYCGKGCQSEAWKRSHRLECKIFARLHPRVLPNSVRAVLQLLLRYEKGLIPAEQWASLMRLQSHVDGFVREGGRRIEGIRLMSRGAHAYSGTKMSEDFVQDLYCKVLINSVTLVTATFDPIGTCLDPLPANINHSCAPNSVVVFDGPRLNVRSTRQIEPNEEITISYIDCTDRYGWRQSELQQRYFFSCGCTKCQREALTQPEDDFVTVGDRKVDLTVVESEVMDMLNDAKHKKQDSQASIKLLKDGLKLLNSQGWKWPISRQPAPSIRQQLAVNFLVAGDWTAAAIQMLALYFHVDPILFPEPWHPVRVVHNWTLVTLMLHLTSLSTTDPDATQPFDKHETDYGKVVWGLLMEVLSNVDWSHGSESAFAAKVKRKVEEVRVDMTRGEEANRFKDQPGQEWLAEEWAKLRDIAEVEL
ncbi:MAG: hypothetical protein M4579_003968 [Chaenotheca gracillima]|nr:MAG: hypothetical protein M4579_003968 [Chaenotheca gracillima]